MNMVKYEKLNSKWEIKISNNKLFILLAAIMFCQHTLFSYFEVIISKLPFVNIFAPLFFPVLYILLFFMSYSSKRMQRIKTYDIFIILFFAFAIFASCVLYPKNEPFIIESLASNILPAIPFFLLGLCISLNEETLNTINNYSCVAIIVSSFYMIYYLNSGRALGGSHGEDYSMYSSYLLLPNTMMALEGAFRRKNKASIICSILGVIYAFAMGTRGPIIILVAFFIICVWLKLKIKTWEKLVIFALIATILILFVKSSIYINILLWIKNFLEKNNVSARVIDYLISGEMISETSGRNDIYKVLLEKLDSRLWVGYGVYGEYPMGYQAGAHNIYLQVLFHFGVPIGLFLLFSYIVIFVRALRYAAKTNKFAQGWILLFGCMVFIRGIFGSNYFNYDVVFLLGICLNVLRQQKTTLLTKKGLVK